MSKFLFLALGCSLIHLLAAGYHIIGGEMYYQTVAYNSSTGRYRYLITLKLYRDADFTCGERQGCLDRFENPIPINIYTTGGGLASSTLLFYIQETRQLIDTLKNPCLAPQTLHLEVAFYRDTIELEPATGGYYVVYQRCCRGEKLANIYNSELEGTTFYTVIPGIESRPNNNSAHFNKDAAIVICDALPFRYDYAAVDEDGDSLTYHLCSALTGGVSRSEVNSTDPPPYNKLVSYVPPYSGANPMGGSPRISIDNNGLITGTPDRAGKFVISVCIDEYDRITKKKIGTHHKDLLLTVFNCRTEIKAGFPSVLNNCTDSTGQPVTIPNYSNAGYTSTYYWDFGDGTDTITHDRTVVRHLFPDTGRYLLKLVVNRGLSCIDSTTGVVNNYPGLRAGFTVSGQCRGQPIVLQDTSSYVYGNITQRSWSLGLPNVSATGQLVTTQYAKGGVYTVTLLLETDKECTKTFTKNIRVYEVNPFAGNDTILTRGQLLPLHATGGDFYEWRPPDGLSNALVADPVLSSDKDVEYILKVSNEQGCTGYDTLQVKYYAGPDLYVPNAFTPNGDGKNDRFRFIPVGFVNYDFFRIFNRWGQEIYSSVNFRMGWDGTIGSKPAPIDTYMWILQGKDLNGKTILRKGTVTLIR